MFLVLAREEHFGRSAQLLHVSQPTLSQSIKKLEETLGVSLFVRTTRRVKLSDAGRVFEKDIAAILDDLERAQRVAKAAELGSHGIIRVGFPTLFPRSILPLLATRLRESHPHVELRPQIVPSREQIKMIDHGQLDTGFVWNWDQEVQHKSDDLEYTHLSWHPMIVAIPADSRLALLSEPLDVRVLKHEKFIMFPSTPLVGSVTREAAFAVCRQNGFVPEVVQEIPAYQIVLELVGSGVGVSLVPDAVRSVDVPGVVTRHLRVAQDFGFKFVSRNTAASPLLRTFNSTVADVAASYRRTGLDP